MADLDQYLPAIAAGDSDAFARWVAGDEFRIRASLRSFATVVDTEAIVQETLLRIWQVAPRVKTDAKGDCLMRLAIRIAHNLAISETRRARGVPTEHETLEHVLGMYGRVDESSTDPLLRRVIALCREKLPKKPALALDARLGSHGGLPDESLAEQLGMKLNTFLQNFTRARRFLAECLRDNGVDLERLLP